MKFTQNIIDDTTLSYELYKADDYLDLIRETIIGITGGGFLGVDFGIKGCVTGSILGGIIIYISVSSLYKKIQIAS